MKKWLISMMAVATLLLAGSALADGNITLSPDGSTSTDASVRIDGQTVTITQAGTYQIAGTLDDGALIVESAENAKITLVLGGVSIKNSTGAAIQIATADDVTIELAEGTTNVLQSGEKVDIATATESEEASGGALQSKADLKIKGKGSLTVLGYLNNGIHCTKDLKIKNGNISVTALGHGIKGKNSVTVSGGTVTVTSGKDGITSDETENEEKGFVTIEDGEIIITSAGDGVSAETTLTVTGGVISIISGGGSANAQQKTDNMRDWWDFDNSASDDNSASCKGLKAGKAMMISGGSITIDAQDDALHTNGDMTISGGECILSTGDDGAHAALSLTVLGGKITVLTSYEGLEANQITLAGGELDITATDDGINANGGSDGFSGGFGGGFGGGRSANPNAPRRGEDIRANVVLDFMEACKGKTVKLRINRAEKCPDCHGTGAAAGSSPKTCPDCHGTGTVRITQRTPFGNIAQTTTCSRCGGKGQIIDNPCHTCNGQGRVKKVSEKEINVPAGIDDGQTLRVGGEGNCGINGGPNGDLHINITVRPDPIFERDGYDVWTEIPLTYAQATLGDEITVPTVDGKVKYTVPEGTQTGTVFRLRGKGIKKVNRNDHGDHYVRVTVEVPRNLTKEQKEKLRDYEKSLGEKNYAKRKTFFDKLKDKFK